MRYRPLGRSGLIVSVVGLGCNNLGRGLDVAGTRKVLDAALDVGITLLDLADTYGGHRGESEEILGEVLGSRRDEVVLSTKALPVHKGRPLEAKRLRRSVEKSLKRLRTDHVDLFFVHGMKVRDLHHTREVLVP